MFDRLRARLRLRLRLRPRAPESTGPTHAYYTRNNAPPAPYLHSRARQSAVYRRMFPRKPPRW